MHSNDERGGPAENYALSSFGNSTRSQFGRGKRRRSRCRTDNTLKPWDRVQLQQRTFGFSFCGLALHANSLFADCGLMMPICLSPCDIIYSNASVSCAPAAPQCDVVWAFCSGFLHSMKEETAVFQRKSRFRLPFLIYCRQWQGNNLTTGQNVAVEPR